MYKVTYKANYINKNYKSITETITCSVNWNFLANIFFNKYVRKANRTTKRKICGLCKFSGKQFVEQTDVGVNKTYRIYKRLCGDIIWSFEVEKRYTNK